MKPSRPGVTLIETLVSLAVIGVLLAFLLPAVQRVRAAAVRIACANKARQLGLALHLHHDVHNAFPQGYTRSPPDGRFHLLGWPGRVLPFLEQEALWKDIDTAFRLDPDPATFFGYHRHDALMGTPVAAFVCPADPRLPGPHLVRGRLTAFTSYLGVSGTDKTTRDGTMYVDSRTRLLDVRDGTSNTLLLGERSPSKDFQFGWWYRAWGQSGDGSADMILGVRERNVTGKRYGCPPGPHRFSPGRLDEQCDMFHFWSPHGDGGHFVFADGSARYLTTAADAVFPALATRAGGEVANAD